MTTLQIAAICHDANRALCRAQGDLSQLPWEDALDWQIASAVAGVEKAQEGMGPEALHEAWSAHKRAAGWVWGRVKDPEAKTHPCLVPYHLLPPDQQVKDYLFHGIVRALSR